MYQIDVMSRIPVYEQIVEQTEKFILAGVLCAGDKIPSVRSMSVELSVNPNTIQKAVAELDRRGLIFSVPGKGSFVSERAKDALTMSRRNGLGNIRNELREMKMAGISQSEIIKVVKEVYQEEVNGND